MAEIKNVADKTNQTTHTGATVDETKVASTNWISQINAGGTVYDIATHHGIKFRDGSTDTTGVVWNGLTDIEIVIPSITDIVQTPIEFVGTVNADGKVMDGTKEITTFEKGNLVFIAANCTFNGKVCEAGDMAIYDGSEWKVVTGENQVSIVGNNGEAETTIAIGPAKQVLTVEGKTLTLSLDYADLNGHVSKTIGGVEEVKFGAMTVGTTYVGLTQANGTEETIGKIVTLQKASQLTNGEVTFKGLNDLVTDVTFGTFDAGSLHQIVMNSEDKTFDVSGGSLTLTSGQQTGHFVDSVSLGNVTFGGAEQGDNGAFTLVNGISAGKGQSFVTGVDGKTTFTVVGSLQPTDGANTKFVTNTGDYVTGLNKGSFTLTSGDALVTGFGSETTTKGDVISSVEVTAKNDTSVFNEAKVENHVLSFGSTNVASGVTVTPKYKSLTKTGFTYSDPTVQTAAFTTSGFTKASDVTYTLGTAQETTYTTTTSYYKLTTPALQVTKGGYTLSNTGMVATVPKNTFAVNVSGGSLPSLTAGSVSRNANITGSVATGLDYANQESFIALNSTKISMPGAYSLVEENVQGAIAVGKEGTLDAYSATIDLKAYLKDVGISETKVTA